VCLSVIMYPR